MVMIIDASICASSCMSMGRCICFGLNKMRARVVRMVVPQVMFVGCFGVALMMVTGCMHLNLCVMAGWALYVWVSGVSGEGSHIYMLDDCLSIIIIIQCPSISCCWYSTKISMWLDAASCEAISWIFV